MPKADSVHSMPPTNSPISQVDATSRCRFLTNAAGLAAGGTALALAIPPAPSAAAFDPVFDLIAAHREVNATVHAIEAEATRQSDLGIAYLDEIEKRDHWKFEDNYATPLIGNLAAASSRIAASS
jgi:hypothetical protein